MSRETKIEVFSAGCPMCNEALELVNRVSPETSEVQVLDLHDAGVAERAKELGVRSAPAVVVDGKLASCCAGRGVDEATLRAAVQRPHRNDG